jgi:hypothetical protein
MYPNADICKEALDQVIKQDQKAICIPAGMDQSNIKMDAMIANFLNMAKELNAMDLNSGKE